MGRQTPGFLTCSLPAGLSLFGFPKSGVSRGWGAGGVFGNHLRSERARRGKQGREKCRWEVNWSLLRAVGAQPRWTFAGSVWDASQNCPSKGASLGHLIPSSR